jgi:AraC family ethanolamine operon transcriptional activator
MPEYLLCANPHLIADAQYDDFEQQAMQLLSFDQSYLQLSAGSFRGRFLSCFLGDGLSLHIEHCNQALEQSLASDGQAYSIGVVISLEAPFRLNGRDLGPEQVMIAAPGSSLHLLSPPNGAIIGIVVGRDRMEAVGARLPQALEWLAGIASSVRVLQAPELARRIREDTVQSLQAIHFFGDRLEGHVIGDGLLSGILSKIALELTGWPAGTERTAPLTFERFIACRDQIQWHWDSIRRMDDLLAATGEASRRTVETSFSEQIGMGPLAYQRLLRLHMARSALGDPTLFDQSIGDIAARFDFWNGGQFANHYQSLFGELPSDTRRKRGYQPNRVR